MKNTQSAVKVLRLSFALMLLMVACSPEKRDWEVAETAGSLYSYNEYLAKYPQGEFADSARRKIEELEFLDCQTTSTVEAYQAYLARYPNGPFSAKAREGWDDLDWLAADQQWSLPAWRQYLTGHAEGKHAGEARTRIEALENDRAPELRNVKTVRIVVRQSFSEDVGDTEIAYEPELERFFEYYGLERAEPEVEADATISVRSYAEAWGDSYSVFAFAYGGTYYYTGASVSGKVQIEVPGQKPMIESFYGEVPTPNSIYGGSTEPSGAPYDEAMEKDFPRKAVRILARAFGYLPLIGAMGSGDWEMSKAAISALAGGGEKVREPLIAALSNPSSQIRVGAAEALGGHKTVEVADALIACLGREADLEMQLRLEASEALSAVGTVALPALEKARTDERPLVREGVVRALGGIRKPEALSQLVASLDDTAQPVRDAAIAAIGEHRSHDAVNVLIDRLEGGDEAARTACLDAISKSVPVDVYDEESEEPRPSFSWNDAMVSRLVKVIPLMGANQEPMVSLLYQIGSDAVTPLIRAMKSDDAVVRKSSADALGRIGDDRAVRPLRAAAADPDNGVRLEVSRALPKFYDEGIIEPLARLLADPDDEIRSAALLGLNTSLVNFESRREYQRALSSPKSIRILVEEMSSTDDARAERRIAAAALLGRIGKSAVESLLPLVKSETPYVRDAAISALAETGDDSAIDALTRMAEDPSVRGDDALMVKLYQALGASGNRKVLSVLMKGLGDDEASGRKAAAVSALIELDDIRAVDGLIAAMGDGDDSFDSTLVDAVQTLTQYYPEEPEEDWKTWWKRNRSSYGLRGT